MTVLVIGAAGVVGPWVVRHLLQEGQQPRVLARDPERARDLLPTDVEVRRGDPGDETTLLGAASGVDGMFLLTGHDRRLADLQLRIIRTVRRLPLGILKLSATDSAVTPDGPQACRQHWEIEQILRASGQPHIVLRPNAFMESILDRQILPAAQATGVIDNPIADAGLNFISAQDVGAVAARLMAANVWDGRVVELTGPAAVSYREIASTLSTTLHRVVTVNDITPAVVRQRLEARGMAQWEAEHFEEMFQLFRDRQAERTSPAVSSILGRPPVSVANHLKAVTVSANAV